jgi:hypothetical protein
MAAANAQLPTRSSGSLETYSAKIKDAPGMGYNTQRGPGQWEPKEGGRLPTKIEGTGYFKHGMYGEEKRLFYLVCQYFDSWDLFEEGAGELVETVNSDHVSPDPALKVPKYLLDYDTAFYMDGQNPSRTGQEELYRSPKKLPFGSVPDFMANAAFKSDWGLPPIDLYHPNSQLTLAQVEKAMEGGNFNEKWEARWAAAKEGSIKGLTKQSVAFEVELAYRLVQLVTSMAPRLRETPYTAGLCNKMCKDTPPLHRDLARPNPNTDQIDSKQDWGIAGWDESTISGVFAGDDDDAPYAVKTLSEKYFSYFAGQLNVAAGSHPTGGDGSTSDSTSSPSRRTRLTGKKVWETYKAQRARSGRAKTTLLSTEYGSYAIINEWRLDAEKIVQFLSDKKNIPAPTGGITVAGELSGYGDVWPAYRNTTTGLLGGQQNSSAAGHNTLNYKKRIQALRKMSWDIYAKTGFNVMLWPKLYPARATLYNLNFGLADPLQHWTQQGSRDAGPGISGPFFGTATASTKYTGVGMHYGSDSEDWFSLSDPRPKPGHPYRWEIPTVDQLLYDRVVYHTIWVPRRRWGFYHNYSFPQPVTYAQPFGLTLDSRGVRAPERAFIEHGAWDLLLQGASLTFNLAPGHGIQTKPFDHLPGDTDEGNTYSTAGETSRAKIAAGTGSPALQAPNVINEGWVTSLPSKASGMLGKDGAYWRHQASGIAYPWGNMFWNRDLQIYWQHEGGQNMTQTMQSTDQDYADAASLSSGLKLWWKEMKLRQESAHAARQTVREWKSVLGTTRERGGLQALGAVGWKSGKSHEEGSRVQEGGFYGDVYGTTPQDFGYVYMSFVLGTVNKRISELLHALGAVSLEEVTDGVTEAQESKLALAAVGDDEDKPAIAKPAVKAREAVTIWDQQCFLMENIRVLSYAAGKRRYPNFGLLKGKPGNLVSRLNHAAMSTSAVRTLLDITPDVYALLTPYIKLTRVRYDPEDVTKVIGEDPLPFESYTSREDIDKILTSRAGRQSGAGIKSFQWSLKGVQPAEVDNNITATLVVHFQSLYDLFKYNVVSSTGDAQAGIVDPKAENQMAGFLDLIMAPETVSKEADKAPETDNSKEAPCDIGPKVYEGCYYRIKAEVGWSIPTGMENHPGISDPESLRQALEYQRKVLFLQIARHEIDFKQDGSLTLTVTYQAALDGMLKSTRANIFASEKLFAKGGPVEELKEARAKVETERGRNNGEIDYETSTAYKEYEELLEEVEALERQDKMIKYQQVLKQIFEVSPEVRGTRIYSIRVGMTDLIQRGNWGDMTPDQRRKQAEQRQKNPGFVKIESAGDPEPALVEAIAKAPTGTEKGFKDALAEVGTTIDSIRGATPQDMVDIHYFYFGDLIYSVLQLDHIKKFIENKNFQIVLGTIELIDPLVAYQFRDFSDAVRCQTLRSATASRELARLRPYGNTQSTGVFEHFDIANIPISVDAFSEWFLQNVIKPGRDSYYLLHFIKDVLASLVSAALNPSCFTGLPSTPTRFATSDILLKGTAIAANQIWTADSIVGARPSESKVQPRNSLFSLKSHENTPPIPTFFIYSTDSRPQGSPDAAGNPPFEEDLENGIYHFYLGSSAGLVKRINFTRADQPYLREAKIQRYGTLGTEQLRELYNVQMSMIGNTLLKNGQYIFINPVAIGAGNPGAVGSAANLARKIGLGGYFLVTGVDHTISESGFEVQVTALHQAMRKNVARTIDVSPPPVEEGTSPEEAPADSGEGGLRLPEMETSPVDVAVEITKAPAAKEKPRTTPRAGKHQSPRAQEFMKAAMKDEPGAYDRWLDPRLYEFMKAAMKDNPGEYNLWLAKEALERHSLGLPPGAPGSDGEIDLSLSSLLDGEIDWEEFE